LRIIGGRHKGKQIHAPKNLPVRPTTDFAKEGLFNILNNRINFDGLIVLDLFCGTGNISLEFASRGAEKIYAIDKHSPCLFFLKDTAKQLQLPTIFTERADVFKYLEKSTGKYDVVFADPPYELDNIASIHELVFKNNILAPEGLLIIEHGPRTDLSQCVNYTETRKYGNVHFSFFSQS
jgi:16S rRNA (guanine(966)-N(2))-methyltransferase RsmD